MPTAQAIAPPPAPDIPQQPHGNPGLGGGQSGQALRNPAPSHEQTVAALRHFQATGRALRGLLQDPNLGKADMKSAVIDATAKLVGDCMMQPAQAVQMLGQMPQSPYQQKTWLQKMFVQNMGAQIAMLDHHRKTAKGTGDWATESALHSDTSDDHLGMMSQVSGMYGGR